MPTTNGKSPTAATSPRPPWPCCTRPAILNPPPRSPAARRHRGSPRKPTTSRDSVFLRAGEGTRTLNHLFTRQVRYRLRHSSEPTTYRLWRSRSGRPPRRGRPHDPSPVVGGTREGSRVGSGAAAGAAVGLPIWLPTRAAPGRLGPAPAPRPGPRRPASPPSRPRPDAPRPGPLGKGSGPRNGRG